MAAELTGAVAAALLKGVLTAGLIAVLLLAARRWGQSAAGLLAGLPTVTGPALLWLALDRGPEFAAQATHGALAAGIPCALFALVYGLVCRRQGAGLALAAGLAAAAVPLPWLDLPGMPLWLWLLAAGLVCAACQRGLWLLLQPSRLPAEPPPQPGRACGWCLTAAVSGLVSALAAGLAGAVGPFWAGLLTSPPLLAAAVAIELHRRPQQVGLTLRFLHGYAAGLLGRGLFIAVFGLLVQPAGAALAFVAAVAAAGFAGRASGRGMIRKPGTAASMVLRSTVSADRPQAAKPNP